MRYVLSILLLAIVASWAYPVSCAQLDKFAVQGVKGCKCIIYDYGAAVDSISQRNIVQYCPVSGGQFITNIQMKSPSIKWITYEIMDCAILDEENVSCRSFNPFKDKDPKFVSSPLSIYMMFLVDTYGNDDINYLLGIK